MPPKRNKVQVEGHIVSSGLLSGIFLVDQLTPLLEQAAAPVLTRLECQQTLKNLMVFAAQTPITVAENLFEMDQVTEVNCFNLGCSSQLHRRNWQWVLAQSSSGESSPSLQEMAWRKSKAVEMGRLMASPPVEDAEVNGVSLVVGFWIQTLYQARFPTLMVSEIPDCVKTAFHAFRNWQGGVWRRRKLAGQITASLFSPGIAAARANQFWKRWRDNNVHEEAKFASFCDGVGSKRLILYLSKSYPGTLAEFRSEWGMDDAPMVPWSRPHPEALDEVEAKPNAEEKWEEMEVTEPDVNPESMKLAEVKIEEIDLQPEPMLVGLLMEPVELQTEPLDLSVAKGTSLPPKKRARLEYLPRSLLPHCSLKRS